MLELISVLNICPPCVILVFFGEKKRKKRKGRTVDLVPQVLRSVFASRNLNFSALFLAVLPHYLKMQPTFSDRKSISMTNSFCHSTQGNDVPKFVSQ